MERGEPSGSGLGGALVTGSAVHRCLFCAQGCVSSSCDALPECLTLPGAGAGAGWGQDLSDLLPVPCRRVAQGHGHAGLPAGCHCHAVSFPQISGNPPFPVFLLFVLLILIEDILSIDF